MYHDERVTFPYAPQPPPSHSFSLQPEAIMTEMQRLHTEMNDLKGTVKELQRSIPEMKKELLSEMQRLPEELQSKHKSWSWGSSFQVRGCSSCEKHEKELKEAKEKLRKAAHQMNDMPKLFQGDIEGAKSPQSLIREYESFFYKHIGSLKEYHLQKAEEVEAKTYLCQIFQETYVYTHSWLVGSNGSSLTQSVLQDLFRAGATSAEDHQKENSLKIAYSSLLSYSGRAGSCPIKNDDLQCHLKDIVKIAAERMPDGFKLEEFTKSAQALAWSLATVVPPLIPSCAHDYYKPDLHDPEGSEFNPSGKVVYIRPILFASYTEDAILKGWITTIGPLAAKPQQWSGLGMWQNADL